MAHKTWLIVGASRGIGLEFVHQILDRGDQAIATVRKAGSPLETIVHGAGDQATVLTCDVSQNQSIEVYHSLFCRLVVLSDKYRLSSNNFSKSA